ncbi:organic solute transporter subunit alpha-like [Protopterus annectens]|uniref:organic solute transporter subunit alpha-like n=1 Tax=Protopterus annectens TaxID=7888 RepID=UPI001CF9A282|nr:organic solute transporter subunit alpha-like [Protopterus annectens]
MELSFLTAIKQELWVFLIPALMTLILLALFLEEMGFFLRNTVSTKRRCLYLWILGIYPIFSTTSLIGMYIPRSGSVCNFVASLYHSITLWKFLRLITDFFGGKLQMLQQLEGQKVSPNPFPCCCCCCLPLISVNRCNLRWMTLAVFQLSIVRTILFFLCLVLWTDEKYDYGDADYTDPNVYINAVIGVSTFCSFYGYLLFYKATKNALTGYGLRSKFICIIVILVLCGLQSGILETMAAVNVIPCSPPFSIIMRSQIIYHYAIIVEMFFIGLFARYCFRKVEPSAERTNTDKSCPSSSSFSSIRPKVNKSIQTDYVELDRPGFSDTDDISWGINQGYHSDSEDSLCRIEHAPLDKFDFGPGLAFRMNNFHMSSSKNSQPDPKPVNWKVNLPQTVPAQNNATLEANCIQVTAEVHCKDTNEITVV